MVEAGADRQRAERLAGADRLKRINVREGATTTGETPEERRAESGISGRESGCSLRSLPPTLPGAFLFAGRASIGGAMPEMMKTLHRTVPITRTRTKDGEAIKATLSSEAPVERYAPGIGRYLEVLDHSPGSVDLSRAIGPGGSLPLLPAHDRTEMPPPGAVSGFRLIERRLRALLRFGSHARGQELRAAVDEGLVTGVSIGYDTDFKRIRKEGTDDATGLPVLRFLRWTLIEVSLENTPADATAGIGRSLEPNRRLGIMDDDTKTTSAARSDGDAALAALGHTGRTRYVGILADAREIQNVQIDANPGRAREIARNVDDELRKILPDDAVSREDAAKRIGRAVLAAVRTVGPGQPGSESLDAMPARDRSRYSLQRAIQQQVEMKLGRRSSYDGLEAEVHRELLGQRGTGAEDHGGVLIPLRTRTDEELRQQRTLSTTQPTGGATLVGQQVMPDVIDLLRNTALVLASGAKLYPGLQGVVQFNKATADPVCHWMAENPDADVTASEPSYGYVSLSPKTLIGQVQIPRQLLVMSSIDVEADVRMRLGLGHALALDLAALHGTGTDKQPVGIYSAADVQSHPVAGVPDLTDVTTMPGMIADKNADLGALGWMTTPLMATVLQRTPVVAGQPIFVWTGTFREGVIGGYPARATNQMSKTLGAGLNEHGLIFGNWQDLVVGLWGNDLEIVVDVTTKAAKGQIVITSFSMADVGILRGESFVKGTGATLT